MSKPTRKFIRRCRFCNDFFLGLYNSVCCEKAECRSQHQKETKEAIRIRNKEVRRQAKEENEQQKPRQKNVRKCKNCGRDPYPNMVYCKQCHKKILRYEGDGEEPYDINLKIHKGDN